MRWRGGNCGWSSAKVGKMRKIEQFPSLPMNQFCWEWCVPIRKIIFGAPLFTTQALKREWKAGWNTYPALGWPVFAQDVQVHGLFPNSNTFPMLPLQPPHSNLYSFHQFPVTRVGHSLAMETFSEPFRNHWNYRFPKAWPWPNLLTSRTRHLCWTSAHVTFFHLDLFYQTGDKDTSKSCISTYSISLA